MRPQRWWLSPSADPAGHSRPCRCVLPGPCGCCLPPRVQKHIFGSPPGDLLTLLPLLSSLPTQPRPHFSAPSPLLPFRSKPEPANLHSHMEHRQLLLFQEARKHLAAEGSKITVLLRAASPSERDGLGRSTRDRAQGLGFFRALIPFPECQRQPFQPGCSKGDGGILTTTWNSNAWRSYKIFNSHRTFQHRHLPWTFENGVGWGGGDEEKLGIALIIPQLLISCLNLRYGFSSTSSSASPLCY